MKKLVTIAALLAGMSFAFGQGSLSFVNGSAITDGNDHNVYLDTVGGTPLVGTNYVAELYITTGNDPSSLEPLAQSISKFRVTTTASPGTWSGKTITLTNLAGFHFGGLSNHVNVAVRVWDNTKGALTYEQALAAGGSKGLFGSSTMFDFYQIASKPPAGTDNQMVNLLPFALNVPEPSAIALGVLGVAGLLIIRRRK